MKTDINYIKRTHRFSFRFIDFLNGLFLIIPTIMILLSSVMIGSYNRNNMTGLNELLIASLIIGLIGLSFAFLIFIRLVQNIKFTKIKTGLDYNSNLELINKVYHKIYDKPSINLTQIKKGVISSNSGVSAFSWGEMNTAICDDKVILINSRPTGQPITIYENRLNVKRILKNIEFELSPAHNKRS